MALKAHNPNGGKGKDVPQAGVQAARLVGITDLGHQPGFTYQGKQIESSYKVEFTYELVNSLMEDGRPHWVSEQFKFSDWRGKNGSFPSTMMSRVDALDPLNESNDGEDLTILLDKPCMLTVSLTDDGWPKIKGQAAVTGVPLGMEVAPLQNEPFAFDMEAPDMDLWATFPEFKQNQIKNALNLADTPLAKELAQLDEL